MTENEFLLADRIAKIKSTIEKYGEENFYISFSGGKDSTVLSALVDMAVPGNKIPRVYANTGIELNMVRNFVYKLSEKDNRITILKPSVSIKHMLEEEGYPFKSKRHSRYLKSYQANGLKALTVKKYIGIEDGFKKGSFKCPNVLKYQFQGHELPFKVSHFCCKRMKEDPLTRYSKESKRPYGISGIMPSEGWQRESAKCTVFANGYLKFFHPLVPLKKEWEEWFIDTYSIEICDIYKPPYSFERTGCKGCPFALNLQKELDTLEKFFPNERKQCEIIWAPVYAEYRRIGYRLKPIPAEHQITIDEWCKTLE